MSILDEEHTGVQKVKDKLFEMLKPVPSGHFGRGINSVEEEKTEEGSFDDHSIVTEERFAKATFFVDALRGKGRKS